MWNIPIYGLPTPGAIFQIFHNKACNFSQKRQMFAHLSDSYGFQGMEIFR